MESFFRIAEKKICLYGYIEALEQTERFRRSIESSGKEVSYVIDKKASSINNPYVITLDEFVTMAGDNKDSWAFVLCLWDAKTQENIANQLSLNGFNNIVFCPFSDIYNENLASKMRWIYNDIRYGNALNEMVIPKYDFMIDIEEKDFIRRFGYKEYESSCEGWIELWIPSEIIYTANNKSDTREIEYDIHISKFELYHQMYEYVMGKGNKYPMEYLKHSLGGRIEKDFLENRRHMFEEFSRKLKNTPNYFVESPIEAEWNDKGYFNLIDGHHRAIFLIYNGYKRIPLVIREDDYKKYKDWKTNKRCEEK